MLQSAELFGTLRNSHFRSMSDFDRHLLSLRLSSVGNDEACRLLGVSPSVGQRHLRRMSELLAARVDLEVSVVTLAFWAGLHLDCCLQSIRNTG